MIVDGNVIPEDVRIALVEIDPFLDDALVVFVQRQPGRFECPRPLEIPGLDLERVILAVAAHIDPMADGIPRIGLLDRILRRPLATVGENPPVGIVDVADQDVR